MKLIIIFAALCAALQASGATNIFLNKDLNNDISNAKMAVNSVEMRASSLDIKEADIVHLLTDYRQADLNRVYNELLQLGVSEADLSDLRNKTETLTHTTSANVLASAKNVRDVWLAASLSWHHLDSTDLYVLSDDITNITTQEREAFFEVMDIENQLDEQRRQYEEDVNALLQSYHTTSSSISMTLNFLRSQTEATINELQNHRTYLANDASAAVQALQLIIDQIPPPK